MTLLKNKIKYFLDNYTFVTKATVGLYIYDLNIRNNFLHYVFSNHFVYITITLHKKFEIRYQNDYYDGVHKSLQLGFISINYGT